MSQAAFEETGLAGPLAGAATALGWDGPTPLQAAAIPVIRRGGNVLLRGASGAGVTFAWAAGMLERVPSLEPAEGPRVLVLCTSPDRATALADSLARIASLATGEDGATWRGLRVRALAPGWAAADADVLTADLRSTAEAVGGARLKLEGVAMIVLEDVLGMIEAAGRETLERLLPALPRDAQRVFVSPRHDDALDALVEAHARRALTIPARPVDEAPDRPSTREAGVVLTAESDKLNALCALLAERDAQGEVVLARSRARAAQVAVALDRRGLGSSAGGPAVETWAGEDRGTIGYDVPFDAEALDRLVGDAPVLLATPAERSHVHAIARDAGIRLTTRSASPAAGDGIGAWRERIDRAIEEEDIDAQLALLAPLFERHAAQEVAAALSALLRRKSPDTAAVPGGEARTTSAPGAPPPPSFVRLFFSAGQKDGLRPADLVGAIAGETGLPGERIGRIDIRDTFSVAEIDSDAADRVIRALNGTTLRGRSIRVDYDRRPTPGPSARRSRPPR